MWQRNLNIVLHVFNMQLKRQRHVLPAMTNENGFRQWAILLLTMMALMSMKASAQLWGAPTLTLSNATPISFDVSLVMGVPGGGMPTGQRIVCDIGATVMPDDGNDALAKFFGPAPATTTVTGLIGGTTYTCVAATLSGNGFSAFSAPKTILVPIGTLPQTINFVMSHSALTFGNQLDLALSTINASSGYAVTVTSLTPAICTLSNATPTAILTAISLGVCQLQATQAGNTSYAAAMPVNQNVNVNVTFPKVPQNVVYTAGNGQVKASFTPPLSDGGSPITIYALSCGLSTVNGVGSPLVLTGLTNGTPYNCRVSAQNMVGNGVPTPFTSVTPTAGMATASVTTIVVTPNPAKYAGLPKVLTTATVTGNMPTGTLTIRVGIDNDICSNQPLVAGVVSCPGGNTDGYVPGIYDVVATYSGDANNLPSSSTITQLVVEKGVQTATIPVIVAQVVSAIPLASGASGGNSSSPLTIASLTPAVCSVTGLNINLNAAGTCTITADQAGDALYANAAQAQRSFQINAAPPASVPDAPTLGVITPGAGQISVAFTPNGNGGSAITGYVVFCNLGSITKGGASSPIVITGLSVNTDYTCSVAASNAIGNSQTSASATVTVTMAATVPDAPTFGVVTPGNGLATFAFTANGNGGSAILSYTVDCLPDNHFKQGATSPLVVSGLTNGTEYTCTVTATNAVGNSKASATVMVTPIAMATVPDAPTIGIATAGNGQASIAFTASLSNGGSVITDYVATCMLPGEPNVNAIGATSPIVVTGLTNKLNYTCSVRAINAIGKSNPSATVAVTPVPPPATVPNAPTIGQVTPANGQVLFAFTSNGNGGSAITGYTVNCNPGTFTVQGAASPLLVTGLTNGATYTCGVFATNAIGNSEAVKIDVIAGASVPGAPTIGVATPGANQATIQFLAPVNNGGSAITFYEVSCVSNVVGEPTVSAKGAASPIIVTKLIAKTNYTCSVKANNAVGVSVSSAGVMVTPVAVPPPAQAAQVVNFTLPATLPATTKPFVIFATGGGSANPVTFTAAGVCTLSGNTLALSGATGVCSVTANQAGDANHLAANPVTASINVTPGVPSMPQNVTCASGQAAATCTFSAPVANGSTAVTGYRMLCTSANGVGVSVAGLSAPLSISPLPTGNAYSCSVNATNTAGHGESSAPILVTPFSLNAISGGIDINGDGKGEVLLRGSTNNNLLLGTLNLAKAPGDKLDFSIFTYIGDNQRVLGVGDFAGRNKSDLLLQDIQTGDVQIWFGFDGFVDSRYAVRNVKPGWIVEAVADMDGDGKSDIVWRYTGQSPNPNDTGVVFVWYMNGGVIKEIKSRGGAPLSWSIVGAADLTGDALGEIVWVSPTNQIRSLTALQGRNFVNQLIGTVPSGYTLIRATDFTADRKADLLFRNPQGKVSLWVMNGVSIGTQLNLPDVAAATSLYAVADLNGDGTADIVWRKADNTLMVWLMNAANASAPTIIDNAGTAPSNTVPVDP
jgi:hypothetical protein